MLDLWRRHLQPDVLAGAEARNPAAADDLQISSDFRAAISRSGSGILDEEFTGASIEGGDVMPTGGYRLDRHGRTDHAPGRRAGRACAPKQK
jgi:hypothetical protein